MGEKGFEDWDYPQPGFFSATDRDAEGWLRVKGVLLKKGGSTRGSTFTAPSPSPLGALRLSLSAIGVGRRNWSERWFSLNPLKAELRYFHDRELEKPAGVVLLNKSSKLVIPTEVALRGRHAPQSDDEILNYFELHSTSDGAGNTRTTPFVVRALNKMEFDEWLRSLYYVLKRLRFELVPTPTEIILQPNKHNLDSDRAAQSAGRDGTDDEGSEDSAGEYEPSTSTAHADAAATAAATPPTQSASTAHAAAAAVAANAPPPEPHAQKDYVAMEFYYQDVDGAQLGPVSLDGLRAAWSAKRLDALSYIYSDRADEWASVDSLPTLKRLLQPPKPPPPGRTPPAANKAPSPAAKPPLPARAAPAANASPPPPKPAQAPSSFRL